MKVYAMITDHDKRKRRCPRLGNDVPFSYCRKPGEDIPCSKILDCWWEMFDINAFMQENYSKEILEEISKPPQMKTTSLLEMIQQVEKQIKK